jgi:hypothetical protein
MIRWGSVVVALALAAGCAGDPCSGGETVCVDDHTIRRCVTNRDGWAVSHEWGEPEACYAVNPYCVTRDDIGSNVTPQAHGLCAAAPAKLASCETTDAYCADGSTYKCVDGYSVLEQTCTNGCSGVSCAP